MRESKIQTAICKELRKHNLFFFRVNNLPIFDPNLMSYRSMGEFALKGIPDIFLLKPPHGTLIGLEVKTLKGKQSPEQILFQKRLERIGGQYYIVRSVEDLWITGVL